jgi:hypothetical protein
MHGAIAANALHVPERLTNRLAERDPDVLGGVMRVDLKIALGRDLKVDARMAGEKIEHVIEKADAGRNRCRAAAIEIDRHLDVGFLGGSAQRSLTHRDQRPGGPRFKPGFYQAVDGGATLAATRG